MVRVLFVCTGNTCRSPMAEAFLRRRAEQEGRSGDIEALSAGLAAGDGDPLSKGARAALKQRGVCVDGRLSRRLDDACLAADLILTMTEGHKDAVARAFPAAAGKVYTLPEYAGEALPVDDPFGGDDAVYCACAARLERLIGKIWPKIAALAGEKSAGGEEDGCQEKAIYDKG